jgi:DNA-binding GntR family transcriptional regulator
MNIDMSTSFRHYFTMSMIWLACALLDAMPQPLSTNVDRVLAEIRSDILAGRSRPGTRLRLTGLTQRHACSMGVLREALSRLVSQGLVEAEPQHGFRVMSISPSDLCDLTGARKAIETLVVREAVAHGSLAWEGELLAAHHALSRTTQMAADDPDRLSEDWTKAHAAFHNALLDGCPNPRLRAIARSLRDSAELYRQWSVPLGHGEDRDIGREHEALLQAALDRDADMAATILASHIQRTTHDLVTGYETSETRQ